MNIDMIYSYKNNLYNMIGTGKMKDPVTRLWLDSVVYRPIISVSSNRLYTRESKDFFKKFKRTTNDATSNNTGSEL